jgi:hypothetical protein
MTIKMKIAEKLPYVVRLPKGAMSPSGSIYKNFDIVHQTSVLTSFSRNPRVLRCDKPFSVSVRLNGKVKLIYSRKERKLKSKT